MNRAGWLAGLASALLLLGCGGNERFSEGKVLSAAKVEEGEGGELGAVGGDPFCGVDDVLNSAEAIEGAGGEESGDIITSREGNVGVVVVPPFPDDCAETVQKGLNKLDPPEKEGS